MRRISSKQATEYAKSVARQIKSQGLYEHTPVPRTRFKAPRQGDLAYEFWSKRGSDKRLERLRRGVAQFNSTVSRLKARYAGVVQVPNPLNINDEVNYIRSTTEYNQRIREIEGILKKNSKTAQDVVARFNPETGEVVYRIRYIDRMLAQAQKKFIRKRDQSRLLEQQLREEEENATASTPDGRYKAWQREHGDNLTLYQAEYASQWAAKDDPEWYAAYMQGDAALERLNAEREAREDGEEPDYEPETQSWADIDTGAMDADDLTDMWAEMSENAADYAQLYLEVWEAFAGDYDGYATVKNIIEDFVELNPSALEDIFTDSQDPETQIEYMYPGAEGGMVGVHRFKHRASADMTPFYKRCFNIEMFWEEKAAEYGLR